MKPEDLKYPFLINEKKSFIKDRVWFTGNREGGDPSFVFPGWNDSLLFGNNNPISIEYCSGNGLWIAEKAITNPEMNWVAIELKFSRVRKIWAKIKNLSLNNLVVICGEGYAVTRSYFPAQSIESIYINFPDPWPKRKHARHRIIQKDFINESQRVLSRNGKLTFVTDDEGYSKETIISFQKHATFSSLFPDPFYATELEGYGNSFFEDLWREQGKVIRYHIFQKKGE